MQPRAHSAVAGLLSGATAGGAWGLLHHPPLPLLPLAGAHAAAGGLALRMAGFVVRESARDRASALGLSPLTATPAPVLVLGLDCADWRVLQPLLDRVELPALVSLIARGRRGALRSIELTDPPTEPGDHRGGPPRPAPRPGLRAVRARR